MTLAMSWFSELLGVLFDLLWPGSTSTREDRSIVGESPWDRDAKRFGIQLLLGLVLIAGAIWGIGVWRGWW